MVTESTISQEIRSEILRRSANASTMHEVGSAVAYALVDGQVQLDRVSLDEVKSVFGEAIRLSKLAAGTEPSH